MSFTVINEFERALAKWWGAPYAVATDCCTHAIELCLRQATFEWIDIPTHTYISVPMTAIKIGATFEWKPQEWQEYYRIGGTNIVDSAVYWQEGGYIPNTLQCLSFQFRKPLNLGRGGAILCDNAEQYETLKRMTYDGRFGNDPWAEQDISTLGYHYYMTPETAELGLEKLPDAWRRHTKYWSWKDYPYLPDFKVFQ